MPSATVVSHDGNGIYTVRIDIDSVYIDERIAKIQADLANEQNQIDRDLAIARTVVANIDHNQANDELNAAILTLDQKKITEATNKTHQTLRALTEAQGREAMWKAFFSERRITLSQLIVAKSDGPEFIEVTAACLDIADGEIDNLQPSYTRPLLSGTVPLITAFLEHEIGYHIPQSMEAGTPPTDKAFIAADDKLENTLWMPPGAVFWNHAVLPGFQRFEPVYLKGRITEINQENEARTFQLFPGESVRGYPVIADEIEVPETSISYYCGSGPFLVGEVVIVEANLTGENLDRLLNPIIIGFSDKPKPCPPETFIQVMLYDGVNPREYFHFTKETGTWVKNTGQSGGMSHWINPLDYQIVSWNMTDNAGGLGFEWRAQGKHVWFNGVKKTFPSSDYVPLCAAVHAVTGNLVCVAVESVFVTGPPDKFVITLHFMKNAASTWTDVHTIALGDFFQGNVWINDLGIPDLDKDADMDKNQFSGDGSACIISWNGNLLAAGGYEWDDTLTTVTPVDGETLIIRAVDILYDASFTNNCVPGISEEYTIDVLTDNTTFFEFFQKDGKLYAAGERNNFHQEFNYQRISAVSSTGYESELATTQMVRSNGIEVEVRHFGHDWVTTGHAGDPFAIPLQPDVCTTTKTHFLSYSSPKTSMFHSGVLLDHEFISQTKVAPHGGFSEDHAEPDKIEETCHSLSQVDCPTQKQPPETTLKAIPMELAREHEFGVDLKGNILTTSEPRDDIAIGIMEFFPGEDPGDVYIYGVVS